MPTSWVMILKLPNDGGTKYEDSRNDNGGTDSANEVDSDDAPFDDMRKTEGEQTDKLRSECEGSRYRNYEVSGGWKDDNSNAEFDIDLGDLTNIFTLDPYIRLAA